MRRSWLFLVLWLGAYVCLHLPWISHPSAAFTQNAFDLAEQIRFHPAIRAERPALRTSFFLWSALSLCALGLGLSGGAVQSFWGRWLVLGLAWALSLRLLPPQEFLRDPARLLSEAHPRGLLLLTLLGIGGSTLLCILGQKREFIQRGGHLTLGLSALIFPIIAYERAWRLLTELGLNLSLGGGLVLYGVLVLGLVAGAGQGLREAKAPPAIKN